jgi:succinate dehydrogenase/fumarate reductase flavoprotein subunit
MEVAPTAHYSMGGVVVDMACRTKVKRLFAVGETISQIHGANRLGGNSLLDTVVFGKIAGSQAARLAKEIVGIEKTGPPSQRSVNNNGGVLLNGGTFIVLKEPLKFSEKIQI